MFKKYTVANWMERIKFANEKEADKHIMTERQKDIESEINAEFKTKKWTRRESRMLSKLRY